MPLLKAAAIVDAGLVLTTASILTGLASVLRARWRCSNQAAR